MQIFNKMLVLVVSLLSSSLLIGNAFLQEPTENVKSLILKADEFDNPATQLTYLREAYQYVYELEDSLEADLYFQLGVAHGKLYHIDSSKYFLNQALNLATKNENRLLEMGALNGLGNLARIENDNDQAMWYFLKALEFTQNQESKEYINWGAKLQGNLAGIYFDLEEFNQAFTHSEEALLLSQKAENNQSIAYSYSRLGYLYSALDSVEKALDSNQKSLAYFQKAKDSLGLVYQYYSLGNGYYAINELKKSKNNFEFAKQLAEEFGEAETYASSLTHLGLIELAQGNKIAAKSYARNALVYSKKNKLISHLKGAYDLLYKITYDNKQYKKALGYRNMYYLLKDSINNQEAISNINALNAKYKSEKKEKEIVKLNYENELANTAISTSNTIRNVVIIAAIILVAFLIYIYIISKKQFKLKEELFCEEIDNLRLKITSSIQDASELDLSFDSLNETLLTPLTQREFEVLELTFTDKSNGQIADKLFVSINTVKTHLKNVFEKLDVNNRKEAHIKVLNKN
jgi:DNA-binding CsgD family transcriptional regulator/tetratricopeptide (TPR) repeat protein